MPPPPQLPRDPASIGLSRSGILRLQARRPIAREQRPRRCSLSGRDRRSTSRAQASRRANCQSPSHRRQVADRGAVAPLGDLPGVVGLDLVQRIVPVLIVAVDELGGRRCRWSRQLARPCICCREWPWRWHRRRRNRVVTTGCSPPKPRTSARSSWNLPGGFDPGRDPWPSDRCRPRPSGLQRLADWPTGG